ncbi:hypothetical protein SAMN05216503_3118 [Polaribacter sp. KT25b]|uniref:hypothetical protein n=1 Tax=Polaribacter sp. KT25b TaxID=1855336 RepID=UPI00087BD658|nr:hypothetical protein [Polaribacter sp. KT25b]SDS45712.1 hypothetical protein SAMN05216503_3118 [Polaribacter sp. KT25b]
MEDKIEKAIEYYTFKSKEILNFINSKDNLTVEEIIEKGEELAVLESKITALEVAKEN